MKCMIYLTHNCNMECMYCYEGNEKGKEYMSLDMIDAIIDYIIDIKGNDRLSISFLGGEPLLNVKWIYSFIKKIEDSDIENVEYKTTTNGILLDKSIIDYFVKKKVQLSISIDGDRYSNELNRKPKAKGIDCYATAIKNIEYLNNINYPFFARMTVARNTVGHMYNNVIHLYNKGVKNIRLGVDSFADWDDNDYIIFDKQLKKIDRFYLEEKRSGKSIYIDIYDDKFGFYIPKRKIQFCSAGTKNHIVINSAGGIYPCSFVANNQYWKIGDIYTGINYSLLRTKIKKSVKVNNKCKQCKIAHTCVGTRCGFYNYAKNGFLNKIDSITCKLEKIITNHSLDVFNTLLKEEDPKIISMIKYCIENKIEMILSKEQIKEITDYKKWIV